MTATLREAVADLLEVWDEHDLMNSSGSLPDEKAAMRALLEAFEAAS